MFFSKATQAENSTVNVGFVKLGFSRIKPNFPAIKSWYQNHHKNTRKTTLKKHQKTL